MKIPDAPWNVGPKKRLMRGGFSIKPEGSERTAQLKALHDRG